MLDNGPHDRNIHTMIHFLGPKSKGQKLNQIGKREPPSICVIVICTPVFSLFAHQFLKIAHPLFRTPFLKIEFHNLNTKIKKTNRAKWKTKLNSEVLAFHDCDRVGHRSIQDRRRPEDHSEGERFRLYKFLVLPPLLHTMRQEVDKSLIPQKLQPKPHFLP